MSSSPGATADRGFALFAGKALAFWRVDAGLLDGDSDGDGALGTAAASADATGNALASGSAVGFGALLGNGESALAASVPAGSIPLACSGAGRRLPIHSA